MVPSANGKMLIAEIIFFKNFPPAFFNILKEPLQLQKQTIHQIKVWSRAFCWGIVCFCTSNGSVRILKLVGFPKWMPHPVDIGQNCLWQRQDSEFSKLWPRYRHSSFNAVLLYRGILSSAVFLSQKTVLKLYLTLFFLKKVKKIEKKNFFWQKFS